jgi:hypothetical protein
LIVAFDKDNPDKTSFAFSSTTKFFRCDSALPEAMLKSGLPALPAVGMHGVRKAIASMTFRFASGRAFVGGQPTIDVGYLLTSLAKLGLLPPDSG